MATKLLNQRIKDVMCARKRAGKADITPTLVDLERTHILSCIGIVRVKARASGGNGRRDVIKLRETPKACTTTSRQRWT